VERHCGSFQNSWAGPGKIVLLAPESTDTAQWTRSTGTSSKNNIDDVPGTPNDATDYNYISDDVSYDRFNVVGLTASDAVDGSVILMDVYARIGGASGGSSAQIKLKMWDGANNYDGPVVAIPSDTSWRRLTVDEHFVYNTTGKTLTNFNSLDFGYRAFSPNLPAIEKRVTAIWSNAEYVPSGVTPVSTALTHNYVSLASKSSSLNIPFISLMAVLQTELSAYESLANPSALSVSAQVAYEVLRGISQEF
jgi:hypothetical protein